jgi:hypothetical protein
MTQRPHFRDLVLIAMASTLGWSLHSVQDTAQRRISRAYDRKITGLVSGLPQLHGSVELTGHSIRISLHSDERTA